MATCHLCRCVSPGLVAAVLQLAAKGWCPRAQGGLSISHPMCTCLLPRWTQRCAGSPRPAPQCPVCPGSMVWVPGPSLHSAPAISTSGTNFPLHQNRWGPCLHPNQPEARGGIAPEHLQVLSHRLWRPLAPSTGLAWEVVTRPLHQEPQLRTTHHDCACHRAQVQDTGFLGCQAKDALAVCSPR